MNVEKLTAAELQVAKLVAAGKSNQQIADELHTSERTTRTHVSNILAKLSLFNRSEIAKEFATGEETVTVLIAATLTAQETKIAGLVEQSLTNHEIADLLSISERTARTHVSNILNKLGLKNRTQIGVYVRSQAAQVTE